MAYPVADLPYPYEALEAHISAETMRLHDDKHHQTYVDEADAALDGRPRGRAAARRPDAPHRGAARQARRGDRATSG